MHSLVLAVLLGLPGLAVAQDQQGQAGMPNPRDNQPRGEGENNPRQTQQQGEQPAQEEGPQAPPEQQEAAPQPTSMSPEDAKINLPTVVSSFLTAAAPKGVFSFQEKGKRKSSALKFDAMDLATLKKVGENRYSALGRFRDVKSKKPVLLEFVVDFSGEQWKVVSVRLPRKVKKPEPESGS